MNRYRHLLIFIPAREFALILVFIVSLFYGTRSYADGAVIDKIYHPYVDALEQEIEYRMIYQDEQRGQNDELQLHRLSYGHSLGEKWFGEIYLIGNKSAGDNFDIESSEVEAKWQLTEQGEFWADLGLLFEFEKNFENDRSEFETALLIEKEWGKWSGTMNLFIGREWGSGIKDEFESKLGLQLRYRYSRWIEPALELYSGEDTRALGPVLMGNIKTGIRRNLHWETGVIFGLTKRSPDQTFRLLFEYEF